MRSIKRVTNRTVFTALILALALAFISIAMSLNFTRSARAEDTQEYIPTSAGISNTDFTESSGSTPASPSGWTGAAIGSSNPNLVTGVVDLNPGAYVSSESGNEKLKLDQYEEYKTEDKLPKTIFGSSSEYGGSEKALLINTGKGAEAGYTYSSSDMTFEPNSYYRVSAWVKTGDFASDTGATVKLTGLGKNISFVNINTVADFQKVNGAPVFTKDNLYGWAKYTIYVRTSSSVSSTVKLVLGLGDEATDDDEELPVMPRLASGYVFFDTVKAERISASDFAFDTEDFIPVGENLYANTAGNAKLLDLYELDLMTAENEDGELCEIGTFSDEKNNKLWDLNAVYDPDAEEEPFVGSSSAFVYNSYIDADIENKENGFSSNPWAPLGRSENKAEYHNDLIPGTNGNILVISTYNTVKKEFEPSAHGVASPDFTIKRFGYYRFGVWVKGDSIEGGSGITIGVKGEENNTSTDNKLAQWYTGLSYNGDAATYGWTEHAVYIKGSNMSDLTVHFELWFGAPNSKSSGIAMFDNVTFTELKYSEYSKLSASGEYFLTLDAAQPDTGVTNGNFSSIGDLESDNIEFPLPAAAWTLYTAQSIDVPGFSKNEVNMDKAVHGILPVEEYDKVAGKIYAQDPSSFANAPLYNVLVLSSPLKTAYCYRSSDLTVTVDTSYKLEVEMAVSGISDDSYGATLLLRGNGNQTLSSIENITSTDGAFKKFTFYIDAPLATDTVRLEIWLGLNDRYNNTEKLSDGVIYVKSVSYNTWTASEGSDLQTEYTQILNKYREDITTPAYKHLDYGVYSFKQPELYYYDFYSYNAAKGYATPYNYSIYTAVSENAIYGIFNTELMHDSIKLEGFDKKDYSGNMLLLYNTLPNYTEAAYAHSLALVSNMYYRIDVTLKVRLSEEARNNEDKIGAGIKLTGTQTVSFDNIKDTSTLISEGREDTRDYETFKTYSFYIASGSNGGSIGLTISLGGNTVSSYIEGQLIVADVSFFQVNNTVYENAVNSARNNKYIKTIALSEETKETDSNVEKPDKGIDAWVIPTVIFGAALIIAIIIIIVVRIRDRLKKKKKVAYTSEYDRAALAKELDRLKTNEENSAKPARKPDIAESDLDDDMTIPTAEPAEPTTEPDENAAPEEATTPEEPKKPEADDLDD
ncbi:MAG: hypothetical protein J1F39_06105 [Clostridiales bacterium]|nr:hypothetical protein [Clostridiales bacterium]